MALFNNNFSMVIAVAMVMLSPADTADFVLSGAWKSVSSCSGDGLPMMVHDTKITTKKGGKWSIYSGTLHVKQDTLVKSASIKLTKDGPFPVPVLGKTYDDYCKEVNNEKNFYVTYFYQRVPEFPRTCNFKKGVYPHSIPVNDTTEPMPDAAIKMLTGPMTMHVRGYGADKKQVLCVDFKIYVTKIGV